jgi:hypothetical protein
MREADRTLLGPSEKELRAALAAVCAAVNGPARSRRAEPSPAQFTSFLRAVRTKAEGVLQWDGGAPPRRQAAWSAVSAAWWADRLGRKHVRLRGRRLPMSASRPRDQVVGPTSPGTSALAHLAPERAFRRSRGGREDVAVVCACGAAGSPDEVGWMGTCCTACHDRREAGEAPVALPSCCAGSPNMPILAVAISPGSRTVAAGGFNGALTLLDVATGRVEELTPTGPNFPWRLGFSPDGRRLAVSRATAWVWDLGTRQATAYPNRRLTAFAASGEEVWLEAAGREAPVRLRGPGGVDCEVLPRWDAIRGVDFSPGAELLALGSENGHVTVWSVADGRLVAACEPWPSKNGWVCQVKFLGPAGPLAVMPSVGVPPLLWELAGQVLRPAFGERGWDGAALAGGGAFVVAVQPPELTVWEVGGQELKLSLQSWHATPVRVAATPDGRLLAVADSEGTVRLWPWETLRALL